MLSALLAKQKEEPSNFPILELPRELVVRIVACLGPTEQKAKKATRASCAQLRAAVNVNVDCVKVGSDMEGQTLPETLLPQLKTVVLDISNGQRMGLWSAKNLALLGVSNAHPDCTISVEADAAILNLSMLYANLAESQLLHRVRALRQQSWGLNGRPAHFGMDVEVSAKLKLVRMECVDALIHNTLEHDNLTSLCFAPMLQKAWNLSLIREINDSSSKTLRRLAVNFRPFQEVDMLPLAEAKLPELRYLELSVQNEGGFGPQQLQPLAFAQLPNLEHLVIEMTGSSTIPHLGEFLRPLVKFVNLETVEIWANDIDSFAGLWGVGIDSIFLPALRRLKLRAGASAYSLQTSRAVFAANPPDRVVDAFAGLNLDQLELHDIGLPPGACASGIKQLVLTNPRWEDLRIAMSPQFSPDLKVIRVCGASARTVRARMLETMLETPSLEPGWRIGSPSTGSSMHKVRSFVVLHDMEQAKVV